MLTGHPDVKAVAVFGRPDAITGEKVVARIVPMERASLTEAQVKQWCRVNLARYQIPVDFEMATELPTNAAGKILRHVLRERL